MRLQDKIAMVIGGGQSSGRAMALEYAGRGAHRTRLVAAADAAATSHFTYS
jgi:NAD(P)-dependent dehydrogenase (short-subunit alcohol dehydrogenase family)